MVKSGREVMKYTVKARMILFGVMICASANLAISKSQPNPQKNSPAKSTLTEQQKEKIIEQATALVEMASEEAKARRFADAGRNYEAGLRLARQVENWDLEGACLMGLTIVYQQIGENEKAIAFGKAGLVAIKKSSTPNETYIFYGFMAAAYKAIGNQNEAINLYRQCVASMAQLPEREATSFQFELSMLIKLGEIELILKQYEPAIVTYKRAAELALQLKQPEVEALMLVFLGKANAGVGQYEVALDKAERVLPRIKDLNDGVSEAVALNVVGEIYLNLGRIEEAINTFNQALKRATENKLRITEIGVLNLLGRAYLAIGKYDEAFQSFERSLGMVRDTKSNNEQGIQEILKQIGMEGDLLSGVGLVYNNLGQHEKSLEYLIPALESYRKMGARLSESGALNNLGQAYTYLKKQKEAIEYYRQSLALQEQLNNRSLLPTTLNNLGASYLFLGEFKEANVHLEQASKVARELRQRAAESWALQNCGYTLQRLNQVDRAIEYYMRALLLAREVKDVKSESYVLTLLMLGWREKENPKLAVFYGKQAINLFQQTRSQLLSFDKDSQQGFLKEREAVYRLLASLLIEQGRLPEAQQVLNLLKQQEFFEFVRRDSKDTSEAKRAELTREETEWEQRYAQIADRVTTIGFEYNALRVKLTRSSEEEAKLITLEKDLEVAGQAFQNFLNKLRDEFSKSESKQNRIAQVEENQGLRNDLEELGDNSVALYTLVSEDKYRIILITPTTQKAAEFPINDAELSKKVFQFREALQNPRLDPLPLARELYNILFAPIAKDLEGAKAKTLMWSLDGVLRYVPIAALFDGKNYLVEKYRNVVFTPASNARLKDAVSAKWRGIGLGVSKGAQGFSPLPGVIKELGGIFENPETGTPNPKSNGVLPGAVKLDEEFTVEAFKAALRQRLPVVHIASHFQFKPGNETNSFLLLGDGSHLSLADIKRLPSLFSGVELLTLSACETAMGGASGDGKEVDGLAIVAQQQGAKAVLATLWSVADESTSLLMREFYRMRETNQGMLKSEALRQTQLAMLTGKVKATQPAQGIRGPVAQDESQKKEFKVNPQTPFAHPYYWAPFILIGNWK
jgi:CHAT domain-containing protein/Flp pilus assembly protein TadD